MQEELDKFTPNTSVRLINDPLRVGFVCDSPPMKRGPRVLLQIRFDSGEQRVPIEQLEIIDPNATRSNPVDLLQKNELGTHSDFRRTLIHTRFSGRLADVIYSMEATNTDFHAYQFKPVIKMLETPSNSLLIADEVGLGKTIEAGLIWTELRSRYSLNKLWIICPSSLCEKWRFELSDKMGVSAVICNATDALKTLRDMGKRENGFAVITSMQGLRPPKSWDNEEENPVAYKSKRAELARFLKDMSSDNSLIDLLIIDEAHHMRNSTTQTNKLGELMRDVSEYMVFLSATPIHNYNTDLLALLKLLDSETFGTKDAFLSIVNANEPLVKARDMAIHHNQTNAPELKEMLESAQRHPLLENNRQLKHLIPRITDENLNDHSEKSDIAYRLETVNLLSHAITRTRKREVQEWRVVRSPDDGTIEMSNIERNFYEMITDSIRNYATENEINEGFVLSMPQRQMTSCMAAAYRAWSNRKFDDTEAPDDDIEIDDGIDDETGSVPKKRERLIKSIVESVQNDGTTSFADLKDNDSKFEKLRQKLKEYENSYPNQKIIIFSAFRGTLTYLKERFDSIGMPSIILRGGDKIPKEEIIEEFRTSEDIRVLLSSEVGGEGVDLQFCHIVVNYDLPWNPMRLEQRIGRVDRLGQESDKIIILNLLNEGTIDYKIYQYLENKLQICRDTLGEFEAILSEGIKEITDIYLTKGLSEKEIEDRLKQTSQAAENKKQEEERLENEAAHLIAHGDYILQQVNAARDMNRWIDSRDLFTYVHDFLKANYPECEFIVKDEDKYEFEISLGQDACFELSQFIKTHRLPGQTQLSDNIARICQFENRPFGHQHRNKEIISQFHPLVRFVTKKISQSGEQIHPAVALKLPKLSLSEAQLKLDEGIYILVVSLWSIKGLRDTEKLVYAMANLESPDIEFEPTDAEKLARLSIYQGKQWLEAKSHYDPQHAVEIANNKFHQLYSHYEAFFEYEKAKNEDRAEIQERNLDAKMERQKEILQNTIQTNEHKNQVRMANANRARLDKLMARHDQQKREINMRRDMPKVEPEDICIAIVLIE